MIIEIIVYAQVRIILIIIIAIITVYEYIVVCVKIKLSIIENGTTNSIIYYHLLK